MKTCPPPLSAPVKGGKEGGQDYPGGGGDTLYLTTDCSCNSSSNRSPPTIIYILACLGVCLSVCLYSINVQIYWGRKGSWPVAVQEFAYNLYFQRMQSKNACSSKKCTEFILSVSLYS